MLRRLRGFGPCHKYTQLRQMILIPPSGRIGSCSFLGACSSSFRLIPHCRYSCREFSRTNEAIWLQRALVCISTLRIRRLQRAGSARGGLALARIAIFALPEWSPTPIPRESSYSADAAAAACPTRPRHVSRSVLRPWETSFERRYVGGIG